MLKIAFSFLCGVLCCGAVWAAAIKGGALYYVHVDERWADVIAVSECAFTIRSDVAEASSSEAALELIAVAFDRGTCEAPGSDGE